MASTTLKYKKVTDPVTGALYLDMWLAGDVPSIGGSVRPAFFCVSAADGSPTVPTTVTSLAEFAPGGFLTVALSGVSTGGAVTVQPTLWPSETFTRTAASVSSGNVTLAGAVPSQTAYLNAAPSTAAFAVPSYPHRTDAVRVLVASPAIGRNLLAYYKARLDALMDDINNTLGWPSNIASEVIDGN